MSYFGEASKIIAVSISLKRHLIIIHGMLNNKPPVVVVVAHFQNFSPNVYLCVRNYDGVLFRLCFIVLRLSWEVVALFVVCEKCQKEFAFDLTNYLCQCICVSNFVRPIRQTWLPKAPPSPKSPNQAASQQPVINHQRHPAMGKRHTNSSHHIVQNTHTCKAFPCVIFIHNWR